MEQYADDSPLGRRPAAALAVAAIGGATVALAAAGVRRARRAHRWSPPSGVLNSGTLVVRRLGSSGPPVVLLHGMCGSNRYWGAAFDALAVNGRLLVPDLLGFGASGKPPAGYGPREHADAVAAFLAEAGIEEPAIVVGHSMGAQVAIALAHHYPDLVARVVALAPPLYSDRPDARRHLLAMGRIERVMAFDPPARALCGWMCRHRTAAAMLAVLLRPDLPVAVAEGSVQHTWPSYSLSLERLILSGEVTGWLPSMRTPVLVILAADDPVPDVNVLRAICAQNPAVGLEVWPNGGHDLPLTQPEACVRAIRRAIDAAAGVPRTCVP